MRDFDDIIEILGSIMWIFMIGLIVFACGAAYGQPDELENKCIVHDNKIYCEVINKEGE